MLKKLTAAFAILLMVAGIHSPALADNHGEPPIEELEAQFESFIFPEVENGMLTDYDSLDRLEQDMNGIMTFPLTDHYLDTYFIERDGDVVIRATEGPMLVDFDQDFTLEKVNNDHYKLTQTGHNQLRGDYTIEIDYSYEAGKWVFVDRMDIVGTESGGELPDTATSMPLMMLSGGLLMAFGAMMIFRRNRVNG
ncbi:LPXTG cell wall anchor domain-containing protein [Mesobacillus harenae]|uniref:LPXTG cell wall anchor domain-containing protein n=1 Tax=Mesobacillus harenae TaxID=2213203 RepID=UPI0015809109|nr:LPXTG cell wall anchor domain-containing protein [Mesobacillus harenae]